MPKTGESGASRRARMELKVGKAVAKEGDAIERLGRDNSWQTRKGDSDAKKFRSHGLAAHDSKDVTVAARQTQVTRKAAIGDALDIGEREMAGFRDKYRKHAEQAASLRLRPMSFENWMKARKGE